ncbi:MAG: hypothetical protein BA873_03090 [Desulfobulbaceae bacterium C00003063]|nr:MAG: hypothetical protein BA873_03090 [Desulfobulbaceae bacterium C00003063]
MDNNSKDNTVHVAQSFETLIAVLTVEREKRQGSYAARNKGISVAQGEILAFIDADIVLKKKILGFNIAS